MPARQGWPGLEVERRNSDVPIAMSVNTGDGRLGSAAQGSRPNLCCGRPAGGAPRHGLPWRVCSSGRLSVLVANDRYLVGWGASFRALKNASAAAASGCGRAWKVEPDAGGCSWRLSPWPCLALPNPTCG